MYKIKKETTINPVMLVGRKCLLAINGNTNFYRYYETQF